jgi:hypothetical protein
MLFRESIGIYTKSYKAHKYAYTVWKKLRILESISAHYVEESQNHHQTVKSLVVRPSKKKRLCNYGRQNLFVDGCVYDVYIVLLIADSSIVTCNDSSIITHQQMH